MKEQLIITHPGSAHFDEVTAISLILAENAAADFRVERREPSIEELDNPEVWVVDVGDRHQPAKRNFDHHQDSGCPAAFVLVAEYLGLKDTLSILPWWDFKDSVDRLGPVISSERFNAGDELVNRNPVETWLDSQLFIRAGSIRPVDEGIWRADNRDARLLKQQITYWKGCPRLEIAGVQAMIGETTESAGLDEYRRLDPNPPDIVISLDRREKGWRLFRFDGAPVDFSRIANHPGIAFAHKNGFMAKTRERLGLDDLIPLVSRAVTRAL